MASGQLSRKYRRKRWKKLEPGYWPEIKDEETAWETSVRETVPDAPIDSPPLEEAPVAATSDSSHLYDENTVSETPAGEAEPEPQAIDEPMTEAEPESGYSPSCDDENTGVEIPEPEAGAEPEAIAEPMVEAEPEAGYWPHLNDEGTV